MTLSRADEEKLIERAKETPDAFGSLYDNYVDQIYRFIYSRVHDSTTAEDITSDVFFKALRSIGKYTSSGRPFSAWLYQISINAITDHYRRTKATTPLDDAIGISSPHRSIDDQVVDSEEAKRIWGAIDSLTPHQRTAMTLKLGEDLKISQIAIVMGKSDGAVKLLLHRGMLTLRDVLRNATPIEEDLAP